MFSFKNFSLPLLHVKFNLLIVFIVRQPLYDPLVYVLNEICSKVLILDLVSVESRIDFVSEAVNRVELYPAH